MKKDEFIIILNPLLNQPVSEILSNNNYNSIILLTIANQYSIFIGCCWRLTFNKKVIATWNTKAAIVETETDKLFGSIITNFEITSHNDLTLFFKDGYILQVFCDLLIDEQATSEDINWAFNDFSIKTSYVVTKNYSVIKHLYKK